MVGRAIEFTDGTVLGFLNANSTKVDIGSITSHQIQFYEGGSARMVISGSGNVCLLYTSDAADD